MIQSGAEMWEQDPVLPLLASELCAARSLDDTPRPYCSKSLLRWS